MKQQTPQPQKNSTPNSQTPPQKNKKGDDTMKSLVRWKFTEERKEHSKDRELLIIIIGIGAILLAVIAKTYIFALLLILATAMLVRTARKKPENLLFNITNIGLFLENDFIEADCIKGFNIIDDPGNRASLILKIEKIVHINEIVPIYDVNIQDIERALTQLEIPKDESLEPTIADRLTATFI